MSHGMEEIHVWQQHAGEMGSRPGQSSPAARFGVGGPAPLASPDAVHVRRRKLRSGQMRSEEGVRDRGGDVGERRTSGGQIPANRWPVPSRPAPERQEVAGCRDRAAVGLACVPVRGK
jgi:hypothetical protein